MKNTKNFNSANSEPLENAQKTRNDVKSVDCIENTVTNDAEKNQRKQEETKDNDGNNTGGVEFYNLCDRANFERISSTTNLRSYSDGILEAMAVVLKSSITLLGNDGCGKKTTVKYTAYRIATGDCPRDFVTYKTAIYEIDLSSFDREGNDFVDQMSAVLSYAEGEGVQNLAVYFNDISMVPMTFLEKYESIISELNISRFKMFKFIVVCKDEQYENLEDNDKFLDFLDSKSVNYKVKPENKVNRIIKVLQPRIEELQEKHGVKFPTKNLETLLMFFYGRSFQEDINYSEFLYAVDMVMARVKLSGRKCTNICDVRSYYKYSLKIMEDLPVEYNRNTAIHESGHILLGLMIPELYEIRGCTILYDRQSKIEGITCMYKTYYNAYTEEDEIMYVAMLLAGRVAELEFKTTPVKNVGNLCLSLDVNRGSGDDLMNATYELRRWVMNCGAYAILGYNVFIDDYANLPSSTKKKVDLIVGLLMKKSFRYARAVIRCNRTFMENMTKHLLQYLVATPTDIKHIMEKSKKYTQ